MTIEASPTHLVAADLTGGTLAFPEHTELTPLGEGFNSRVYQVGEYVVKTTKREMTTSGAIDLAQTFRHEHNLLMDYVGDNVPPTMYLVAEQPDTANRANVLTVQPFIQGVSMGEFLRDPTANVEHLLTFLNGCLNMYRDFERIPDIANVQTRFNVFRNHNLVIDGDDRPHLVDTNFGKIQRSKGLGQIWHAAIAHGTRQAVARLRARQLS